MKAKLDLKQISIFGRGHEAELRLNAATPNLIGKKFVRLTVVSFHGYAAGYGWWSCSCVCGGNKICSTSSLQNGSNKSCGCLGKENSRDTKTKFRKRPYEALFNLLVRSAVREGRECLLTYNDFLTFTRVKNCFYCGEEVTWVEYNTSRGQACNLDRKDATKGYSVENVVVCCSICNTAKSNRFTFIEWVAMTKALRVVRGLGKAL